MKNKREDLKILINSPVSVEDAEITERFRVAVSMVKKRQRLLKKPVAGYNKKGAYLKYPDGHIEYVDERNTK